MLAALLGTFAEMSPRLTMPAVLLLVAFAWMELVWAGRDVPARLAGTMLLYSALTWLGMLAFGRQAWLDRAEVFTIVFGIFARKRRASSG